MGFLLAIIISVSVGAINNYCKCLAAMFIQLNKPTGHGDS